MRERCREAINSSESISWSDVKGPLVVDLHEDISWYYSLGDRLDFPLRAFSEEEYRSIISSLPNSHGIT